jgi:ribosome-interacting GTPase 1
LEYITIIKFPDIFEGVKNGKGKGRQVIGMARACDLILVALDAVQPLAYKGLFPDKFIIKLL